jgi:hypothetical protein
MPCLAQLFASLCWAVWAEKMARGAAEINLDALGTDETTTVIPTVCPVISPTDAQRGLLTFRETRCSTI